MKRIIVSKEKPPKWILDAVKKKFGVEWIDGMIFTYVRNDDTKASKNPEYHISTPGGTISEDLFEHEKVHIKQQGKNPDTWWKKYLEDEEFRSEQELEAYQKQFEFVKLLFINRKISSGKLLDLLQHYARLLSGSMYGSVISYDKALQLIKNEDE